MEPRGLDLNAKIPSGLKPGTLLGEHMFRSWAHFMMLNEFNHFSHDFFDSVSRCRL